MNGRVASAALRRGRGARPSLFWRARASGSMIGGMTLRLAVLLMLVPAGALAQPASTPLPPVTPPYAPLPPVTPTPAPAEPATPLVAPPVAAADAEKTWRDLLVVEGLIDVYYAYQVGGAGVQSLEPHVFDDVGNSFVPAFAKVGFGVKPEPVGLRVDIGFGHVADVTASDLGQPDAAGIRPVQQAYLTFAVPTRVPFTIDVGKFVSSAGAEVIEANRNWNYSRSYMFGYATPYTLTGLRATVSVTPRLTLQALVVNGWDVVFDNNGAKTYGLSASYAAATGTTVTFNGLAGIETVGNAPPWRLLADVVVAQKLGRADFMLNADFAREGSARWYGVAAYARLAVATHLNLALRGELFADPQGVRLLGGANQNTRIEAVTLTAGIPIGRNAELRAEAHVDFSNQPLFPVDTEMTKRQLELLAAALAWF
jgi:hypothetical protein